MPVGFVSGKGTLLSPAPFSSIDGESMIWSVIFPPRSLTSMPLLLQRHHPECATPKKLTFGEKLADVLLSTRDGLVWRHPTNAAAVPASRLLDVPEKYPKLSNDHIWYSYEPGTRYVPTKYGRCVFLFHRSVCYLYFTCLRSGARTSPQKSQRFSRTVTKKNTASEDQRPNG